MAKCVEPPSREIVKALEKKLDKCRNQENNPDSEMYVSLCVGSILSYFYIEDYLCKTKKF